LPKRKIDLIVDLPFSQNALASSFPAIFLRSLFLPCFRIRRSVMFG
jgi:hypothetical protein